MSERDPLQSLASSPAQRLNSETTPDDDLDDDGAFSIDIRKLVISAFIIWQIFAVTVWLLPERSPRSYFEPIVYKYMAVTGCWQLWTMFAPNPAPVDVWVEAKIDYADGTHYSWDYMRNHNMGYVQRYDDERFRKMVENAHSEDNKRVWPYLTRYAAMCNDRGNRPGTYPMTIHLIRHFRVLAAPPLHTSEFNTHEFYTHTYTASPLSHRSHQNV